MALGAKIFLGKKSATAERQHLARLSDLPVRLDGGGYARLSDKPARMPGIDQALIWVCVTLLAWGVVMVYSATIAMPDNPRFAHHTPYHYVLRHSIWICLSMVVAFAVLQVPMTIWEKSARWMFVSIIVMLILVLLPFVGTVVNGARRWISLGFFNFQPSELAKIAIVLYAANYMVGHLDVKDHFVRAVAPMAVSVAVIGMLLLAQPDMGAFMVIAVIAMGILFLGGVNGFMTLLMSTVFITAFVLMILVSPWRRERIFAYLNPWSEEHALGKGYQLSHALIAIGRGEGWGVGLGASIEKLHWLPEAHTDFLTAIIGEEFGFVGLLLIAVLFLWLTRRIMVIGRKAVALDRVFSGLVAQGVALWLGFQAFINIGVNLGALPTKGLTLPFMSYGGSAIMSNMIAIALVLRVDLENRRLMHGVRV